MRKFRVFTENLANSADAEIPLTEAIQHRLSTVLRLAPNTEIECFDGQGHWQSAILRSPDLASATKTANSTESKATGKKHRRKPSKQNLIAMSLSPPALSPRPALQVRYGIALIKGERFEWALQKMTEMGVTDITPLICQHGEVKLNGERLAKKMRQWQAILIAAAEQCHLNWLPTLNMPSLMSDWCSHNNIPEQKQWILSPLPEHEHEHGHENEQAGSANEYAPRGTATTWPKAADTHRRRLAICSGPEGGFSAEERQVAKQTGFESLTLGPRILRAETAPIAALTLGHWLWGDFS